MAIPVPSNIKKYAREDINQALDVVRDELQIDIELNNLSFDAEVYDQELKENGGNYNNALTVYVTAELHSGEDYSERQEEFVKLAVLRGYSLETAVSAFRKFLDSNS